MLAGRMMDFPLTVTHLLDRAETYFGGVRVESTRPDRSRRTTTYAEVAVRARKLASALRRLGVREGDRVATLCWNHAEHLEAYLGVPAMGAVVHTLNLRLAPGELGYIAKHAEDVAIVVDQSLLPLFEKFRASVPSIRHVIVVADKGEAAPDGTHEYEALLAAESGAFAWPKLDENAAAMLCYTSGTTGDPKGVLYSHRSTVLHAIVSSLPNQMNVSQDDTVCPVVPMFHAAAWGLPYIAILAGAEIVFPGPHLDAVSLLDLFARARVTLAGGVPTIWLAILAALDAEPKRWDLSAMRTMLIGGSAAPPSLIQGFDERHRLEVVHAWGMTETNPLGTMARVKKSLRTPGDPARELAVRATQGYAAPFVETRHVDDAGAPLPRDASSMGELEVRGPWVAASYFGSGSRIEGGDRWTADGWFKTGDVVTIDAEGYVTITDRAKDVVKSGGEWISSVAVENALMSHPCVLEAAVFAARHPKWIERPVAAIVLKPGAKAADGDLSAHLASRGLGKIAIPDAYVFLEQIPRTSTGKFLKTKLRELYAHILEGHA